MKISRRGFLGALVALGAAVTGVTASKQTRPRIVERWRVKQALHAQNYGLRGVTDNGTWLAHLYSGENIQLDYAPANHVHRTRAWK